MGLLPKSFVGRFPFIHVPWTTDVSAYRKIQNVLDIGLAPIKENPWSACRSDLKALEYLMVGAVPILSDAIPYRDWVDGDGCRKAADAHGFLRATQELVNDMETARGLARAGQDYVMRERTIERNAWRWREAIDAVSREAVAA